MHSIYFKGMAVMMGLIVAIGAQNAWVLRQGLARQHLFAVALVCFLCDITLIFIGVMGLGELIAHHRVANLLLSGFGALFLSAYGVFAWRRALRGQSHLQAQNEMVSGSLGKTIAATLAVTLLNPHVYLDTVVLVGSVAAPYMGLSKWWFLAGVATTSFLWFFSLSYGAAALAPILNQRRTWQILDWCIGAIMFWIASGLWLALWRALS